MPANAQKQNSEPITANATSSTAALQQRLLNLSNQSSCIFGMEDHFRGSISEYPEPTFIGSDAAVKQITGQRPALMQYIYEDPAWSSRYGAKGTEVLRKQIIADHEAGQVVMLMQFPGNPVTGNLSRNLTANPTPPGPYSGTGYPYDLTQSPVSRVLTEQITEGQLIAYLDRIAQFLDSLVDSKGQKIPIIYRPWHEANGSWFWWSSEGPEQFCKLWKKTVNYLQHYRGVTNVLYCINYSTEKTIPSTWYPGDDYVDILSIDHYDDSKNGAVINKDGSLTRSYHEMTRLSTIKPMALAEFGYRYGATNSPRIWSLSFETIITNYQKFSFFCIYAWPYGPNTSDPVEQQQDLKAMVTDARCITLERYKKLK